MRPTRLNPAPLPKAPPGRLAPARFPLPQMPAAAPAPSPACPPPAPSHVHAGGRRIDAPGRTIRDLRLSLTDR
ncbi:MAG: hypothetical protein ACK4WH_10110, partial [Phycisphaerales bacterium]